MFEVTSLGEGLWRIRDGVDNPMVDCYLAVGRDRALLIDAGISGGDLVGEIARLTDKPVTLVILHNHDDHNAAAGQFDDVWMSHRAVSTPELRDRAQDLVGGQVFDLGGVCLQAIAMPGHTACSFVLLDRENLRLFTSDSVGAGCIWMQLPESLDEQTLIDSLDGLEAAIGELPPLTYYVGHSHQPRKPLDREYLADLRECACQVRDGTAKHRRVILASETPVELRPYTRIAQFGRMEAYVFDVE